MAIKYDINKKISDEGSKRLVSIWTPFIIVVLPCLVFYLASNGKHNKVTYKGFETNIPKRTTDTTSKSVTINGDYVNGNKTVNNNFIDSTKRK